MRKVFVNLSVKLVLDMDEGIEVSEVIDELEYGFTSNTEGADVMDTEIVDFDVIDSK